MPSPRTPGGNRLGQTRFTKEAHMKAVTSLVLVSILFFWSPADAEFYKYLDATGAVRFTDDLNEVPPDQRAKLKSYTESVGTAEPEAPKAQPDQPAPAEAAAPPPAGETSDQARAQLDRKKAAIEAEYQALLQEKEALAKEKEAAASRADILQYNEKAAALNQKIRDYEAKGKAMQAEIERFNAQVLQEIEANRKRETASAEPKPQP